MKGPKLIKKCKCEGILGNFGEIQEAVNVFDDRNKWRVFVGGDEWCR